MSRNGATIEQIRRYYMKYWDISTVFEIYMQAFGRHADALDTDRLEGMKAALMDRTLPEKAGFYKRLPKGPRKEFSRFLYVRRRNA